MESCELSRLGPIGFERLVRALCFKAIGSAGVVYSSGPDGGRDFTFEGAIQGYESAKWNGYLVLQAKFKEISSSSADDIDWLTKQIDREFKKLQTLGTRIRHPEYYILATNVRLSGSDGVSSRKTKRPRKGGYSKIIELFQKWKSELGLKEVDIWPHDKIVDLLLNAPEIRHAYAAWVTPGDILTKALEHFKPLRPDFGEVISRSLKNLLHKDQYVRLKDAGSVGDLQIRTSQVFVDLPLLQDDQFGRRIFSLSKTVENDDDNERKPPANAVAALVERAREKLDPESLLQEDAQLENNERRTQRNRIVLMGGPGQGKSTASLFLTQVFRSAILAGHQTTRRDHSIKNLIPEIIARADGEMISKEIPHRYPLHISLPRFADFISTARQQGKTPPSLLAHICHELAISSDQDIDRSDLRNWLRYFPWLLVLDGLDEVPPSGERPAILEAISAFFTEVGEVNADVLVVVTTRPQGYNKDLDDKLWQHWQLAELNPKQALVYAKAFGEARYPDDAQRRQEVHALLTKAAEQPATIRLMVSPLQVTILHFIVDTGGGVPTARWTLFNEYFEVLKRREKAKGGETQKILERCWLLLGPIHHRAGLVLQTDSEHAGGAGSRFTHERFRRLIQSYLAAEGHQPEDVERRVAELMSLALHRLVLLSSQEEGTISFDVRSLQEFMAAAALTSEDQPIMESRLGHIAGHSHWRHVFLIAASRCFADDSFHYRRATIIAIPRQLDSMEPDMLGRNGSRLALDLLVDGIGVDHPNSRRPLLQHAMEGLLLGPEVLDMRLASVWALQTADLAERVLIERISEGGAPSALAAWALLLRLDQLGHGWAKNLIVSRWPENMEIAITVIENSRIPLRSQEVVELFANTIARSGPGFYRDRLSGFFHALRRDASKVPMVDYTRLLKLSLLDANVSGPAGIKIKLLPSKLHSRFVARAISVDAHEAFSRFQSQDFSGVEWSALQAATFFSESPNKQTLANALRTICKSDLSHARALSFMLPWTISAILDEVETTADLMQMASEVECGSKGDAEDWRNAEARWAKHGLTEEDLELTRLGMWFSSNVAKTGGPSWIASEVAVSADSTETFQQLTRLAEATPRKRIREHLVRNAMHLVYSLSRQKNSPALVEPLLALSKMDKDSYVFPGAISAIPAEELYKEAVVRALSEALSKARIDGPDFSENLPLLELALSNFPHERELIYPLTLAMVTSDDVERVAFSRLDNEIFVKKNGDSARTVVARVILELARGMDSNLDRRKAIQMIVLTAPNVDGLTLAQYLLAGDLVPTEERLLMLTLFINFAEQMGDEGWRMFIEPLHRSLDARKSGLALRDIWEDQLKLPGDSFGILLPAPTNK